MLDEEEDSRGYVHALNEVLPDEEVADGKSWCTLVLNIDIKPNIDADANPVLFLSLFLDQLLYSSPLLSLFLPLPHSYPNYQHLHKELPTLHKAQPNMQRAPENEENHIKQAKHKHSAHLIERKGGVVVLVEGVGVVDMMDGTWGSGSERGNSGTRYTWLKAQSYFVQAEVVLFNSEKPFKKIHCMII